MCIVVRLAGPGTEAYVNHASEARNARAAAQAGVAPEVLFSDAQRGIIVTRFVEGAEPLTKLGLQKSISVGKNLKRPSKQKHLDLLEKLAGLKKAGIITDKEFQAKKKKILSKI